ALSQVPASSKTVPQSLPVIVALSVKHWSEWQDLNLRPPRPERGNFSPQLDLLSPAYKLHRRPQLAQQGGGASPSKSRRNARYFSPFQILRNVSWVASPSVKAS